ncbi:ABC transporter ATP-binding protein [Anaerotignum lactatifermentans]|uniref:ABC transporter ATP-binding protein n=1 Tax=Anaerotignum lactatifermentans TaxID=160404 RepID=A0ABS2G9G2_9FIRM|nr:ABC transporter ATP-binding protein [Anaerotignum lactatifermentans]MBM6829447.1 ABC transporter ATP-binding protein [Anaerotignum lactatifermentans]MBM6877805.1 ABC transporter ATP-binding protein [Anaerotignum lactatifermentans]MBM6951024.1 ABC transporter ATP-binding protein [Anaerotignum lactatifermentans]
MLEIKDLVKKYGSFTAVDGLCLHVSQGSIFGFVGPNGAGKTTTMRIMAGLLPATSGGIFMEDVDLTKNPRLLRSKIGYMPDFFGVYDNLKVTEYMDFYAGAYEIPYKDRPALIDDLLEIVDLSHKKNDYVDALSRGMKQRLCLARSLIHDPKLLILDEPASGLDPRARVEMKEILKQLQQMGKTVIISSHILPELAEMCTEVGIIDRGRLAAQGTVQEIMKRLVQKRTIYLRPLDQVEKAAAILREQPSVQDVIENTLDLEFHFDGSDQMLAEILRQVIAAGVSVVTFKEKEGNLEEVFMQVTGGDAQ